VAAQARNAAAEGVLSEGIEHGRDTQHRAGPPGRVASSPRAGGRAGPVPGAQTGPGGNGDQAPPDSGPLSRSDSGPDRGPATTGSDGATAEAIVGVTEGPSRAELQDRWQRAVAELDNQHKRHDRQLDQVRRAERDRVTASWLPVLDHLELALEHAQADPRAIVAGVRAVRQQALDVLSGLGYRRINDVGERFDPAVHEAAQVVVSADTEPNTVVALLRPGYTGESALLRPAVVTVAGGQE
jgi:molecular chaperone GrpE